jgi:hypothetical protein
VDAQAPLRAFAARRRQARHGVQGEGARMKVQFTPPPLMIKTTRILIDFGLILVLCTVFQSLKGLYFFGNTSYPRSLVSAIWIAGLFSAISCYPAFLVGVRLKHSRVWFFLLSWATIAILFSLSLSWGSSLTYKVGHVVARDHGQFTAFGVVYQFVLSPPFFMAVWATWLLFLEQWRHRLRVIIP